MAVQSVHQFAEKVVLITDGTTPIGRAVAIQMALQGSYVISGFSSVSDASSDPLQDLRELGTLATSVDADISSVCGAKHLVAEAAKSFGRIDLLVNCLKSGPQSSFEDTDETDFGESINRSLKAAYFVTQAALEFMKPRPKPKIVNVFSACDTNETAQNPLFASSQGVLREFTQSLSLSLPKHFRVNGVAVSEKKKESVIDAELFRPQTAISADDAARTVVYLLSSEAIGLNGQILSVG
ncbi:MAG: SDR family oxidoreductase [Pyrinomonadaceae bacterium]